MAGSEMTGKHTAQTDTKTTVGEQEKWRQRRIEQLSP